MPGAQVTAACTLWSAAEVRRLVPAVPRADEARDHLLEVGLHRFGLTGELGTVRVGEPCSGLRLELVAGEVLRLERERLAQVAVEVGGALAGNPVDEVERDVVKTGIAENVERDSDGIGASLPLERAGSAAGR